ncbi:MULTISPECIES: LamG-like jellyroll fold domain-containing protein [unclassified Amycolatopsis]|uniref:LamG-like jellyroll fold domain-containing protein n=1 Tax=unclassified Amycolatopsis TaxID=2618356 RepID=UPI0028743EB1|nr:MULTISPECIES: LamG-like jellyroll fold domain-containing protein [unclassified Amycolatopsis]MDS0139145.1 glycoside hydrolase family 2 [Amycolatopsis sp. 505]MDS0144377.1 glycoside hydrolase family 2 [Amycolatopsis sp. CM201R]
MLRPARLAAVLALALTGLAVPTANAAAPPQWQRLAPPLSTPWTNDVSPTNALPDYPRPQLTRAKWQNLNGVWEFSSAKPGEAAPVGRTLGERILVPYPVESALSGIMRHETNMWYRRTFQLPRDWRGQRILLHFQAVDYDTTVIVNGKTVSRHTGGYDAFSVDVTDALTTARDQELIVGVADPNDQGGQPIGKQRQPGDGIFYTPSSGIWQTVWMEPVASARIDRLDVTPDLGSVTVTAVVGGPVKQRVEATAYDHGRPVGRVSGDANKPLKLKVDRPHLWSPDDPFLYDLRVKLVPSGDEVGSYFGLRTVGLGKTADGKQRMLLNGKFVMQVGPLDQGFWPDGIYTAPTDAALKFDLEQEKALGFNMVRKHIKVEPDRWYYYADKLGLLVWQDMPAMKDDVEPSAASRVNFESELKRMIDQHRSFPSIVSWVPFNEGWGDYEVGRIADLVKSWDPTRLVNAESGVNCCRSEPDSGKGDVYDDHTYTGPGTPAQSGTRAAVDGEYGGLGLKVAGHEFDPAGSFAYEMEPDSATLTRRYGELQQRLLLVAQRCGVSAGVYTQTTDVEKEVNGFFTYDRQVKKMDFAAVRAANLAVIKGATGAPVSGPSVPAGTPGIDGIAAYPFDENVGTVAEDVVGSHDATLVGGASWTAGKSGSALATNGSGQFADTGAALVNTEGSYSAAAWVRFNAVGDGFQTIVSQDGDSNSAFFLQYSGADHRLAMSFVGTRALAPTAPEANRWYHVVGVRDAAAGTLKLYVDGQLAATKSVCLGEASTGHTVIGRGKYGGGPVDFLNGAVDQVHVYDRALSDSDVSALYSSGK